MLEGVDVSAAAERVYRALLRDPTSSPAYLAAQADVASDEVAERLDELVRLGLVQRLPERHDDRLPTHAGVPSQLRRISYTVIVATAARSVPAI